MNPSLDEIKKALEYGLDIQIKYSSYLPRHEASGLKKGDFVKVKRIPLDYESGWDMPSSPSMKMYVGNVYQIKIDFGKNGFALAYDKKDKCFSSRYFPFFVLEKVDPPVVKLSISEIAEKFGLDEKQIRIIS